MKKLHFIYTGFIIFISCRSISDTDFKNSQLILADDYIMSSAPNEIDSVGFIFAVDKSFHQIPIAYLSTTTNSSPIELRNVGYTRKIGWNVLGNFIGVPNLTANTSFNDSSMVTTGIKFKGAEINRALLLDIREKLAEKSKQISDLVQNDPNLLKYKFYLIIETIKVKGLEYSFNKNVIGDAELSANFLKISSENSKLKWDKSQNFQLSFDLGKPLITFYKAYPLSIFTSMSGEKESVLLDLKQTEPVTSETGVLYR